MAAYLGRGTALAMFGRLKEAVIDFSKAVELYNNTGVLLYIIQELIIFKEFENISSNFGISICMQYAIKKINND